MEVGDEGGGRTAFEKGREQSELMFLTLFAVFFFCVWFLFSHLDSFLIIQGAKSLVDGLSGCAK